MKPNYKALLIGNGRFVDPALDNLRGPANDLTLLERALTEVDTGLFDPGAVRVLRDRPRSEVAFEIESFFCEAERDDLLLFYYSGHGKITPQGGFYFCVHDTQVRYPESTAVTRQNVLQAMGRCRSDRIVVVLDCCHAAGLKRVGGSFPLTIDSVGHYFIYATGAKSVALDADLSPFTEIFVEALTRSETDRDGDGFVSVDEVYGYVSAELRNRYDQRPRKTEIGDVAHMPLARTRTKVDSKSTPKPDPGDPILDVSSKRVDLGAAYCGSRSQEAQLRFLNRGQGPLTVRIVHFPSWLRVKASERGGLRIYARPTRAGRHQGKIQITSNGGEAEIAVRITGLVWPIEG